MLVHPRRAVRAVALADAQHAVERVGRRDHLLVQPGHARPARRVLDDAELRVWPRLQQVADRLRVDLEVRDAHEVLGAVAQRHLLEEVRHREWQHAGLGVGADHRVRFPARCLPVREDRAIIPLERRVDDRHRDALVDRARRRRRPKHASYAWRAPASSAASPRSTISQPAWTSNASASPSATSARLSGRTRTATVTVESDIYDQGTHTRERHRRGWGY